jgi:Regulator of ribonuclease activity B/Family of unknown function (DUF695)
MSDEWIFFPCTIGEYAAFRMLDVGIADEIKKFPPTLAKLRIHYKSPSANGLPTNDEYDVAIAIEEALSTFAAEGNDPYVGRVTYDGHRDFFVYTSREEQAWDAFTTKLSAQTGYKLSFLTRTDHGHQAYWQELYPSADDWRVINDMSVIENLRKNGDDGSASRQFDHWIYFENVDAAQPFIAWATGDRFSLDANNCELGDDGKYCVRLTHHGIAELTEVSSHTIALRRKAEEFGGDYDGWETFVVKPAKDLQS